MQIIIELKVNDFKLPNHVQKIVASVSQYVIEVDTFNLWEILNVALDTMGSNRNAPTHQQRYRQKWLFS